MSGFVGRKAVKSQPLNPKHQVLQVKNLQENQKRIVPLNLPFTRATRSTCAHGPDKNVLDGEWHHIVATFSQSHLVEKHLCSVGSHKILHKILQRIGATVAFAT
jgi:hypothetical protein